MNIKEQANYLDHMMKQTRQHHVNLSAMADVKANMLLTMSSVVATLCLPQLTNIQYRPAVITLILFCLVTIFMACYAVMPKISLRTKPKDEAKLANPQFNPLFFGDFQSLSFEHYAGLMEEAMNSPSTSYELQVREIYAMGQYLARKKYRFLRLAYLSFLSGFVLSIAIMIVILLQ